MTRVTALSIVIALAAIAPSNALAEWAENGTAVAAYPYSQEKTVAVPDGAGGAFIVWQDSRSLSQDIYAQRISADGTAMWTPGGIPICTAANLQWKPRAVPDGAGGIVICWEDERNGGSPSTDVYAQRVNASGNTLWADDGVVICNAANRQTNIDLYFDGFACIAAWQDTRAGLPDVYVQRFDGNGSPLLTANGVAAVTSAGTSSTQPAVVGDGAGGAIVAWEDDRSGLPEVYAQSINFFSTPVWTLNGVNVDPGHNASSPLLLEDGAGGVLIVWTDEDGDRDIYAGHRDATGASLWKQPVFEFPGDQENVQMVSDGDGGMIVAWDNAGSDSDIYALRMSGMGVKLWTSGPAFVCTAASTQIIPVMVSDGEGGAIIAWRDGRNASNDLYAQRVHASGALEWAADGVPLFLSIYGAVDVALAPDGDGGVIAAWSGVSQDIYAQRLEPNYGAWGTPEPSITSATDDPDDQGGDVVINYAASQRDTYLHPEVSYYSIWRAVDAAAAAGMKTVTLAGMASRPESGERAIRVESTPAGDYYWELVGTQTALRATGYSYLAATRKDSTSADPAVHYFQVAAHTGDANVFYVSGEASASSVDNLAPAAPIMLSATRVGNYVRLDWVPGSKPEEPDFDAYAVYRGDSPDLHPDPYYYLSASTDTVVWDQSASTNAAYYYIVTAVDIHENQSDPSNLVSVGATTITGAGDTPRLSSLALRANVPNPFGASTELEVGLPAASAVEVAVFDVAGRRVASWTVPAMSPGWHGIAFDGRDSGGALLPSGVYFYRVRAHGETATRKMVIQR